MALWIGIIASLLFTGIIWISAPLLVDLENTFLPDTGYEWYFWKLPNPTFWTRFFAWSTYLLHQVLIWGLIYYAQTRVRKYSTNLHRVNYYALAVNALFIGLHFLRTHTTYDGLAQDTSIYSSQGSVIVLLVGILIIENQTRGLFFGKKMPFKKEVVRFLRKYHGYYASWAIIYTFHYHPMAVTTAHLWGFFYTFLLLLQGSLFFTRIHTNRYWIVVQEVMVLFHGTLVAYSTQQTGLWTMFMYGFLFMFVVTQMYALGLSKPVRWSIFAISIGSALVIYSGLLFQITQNPLTEKTWIDLNEIIRIPAILYGLSFLIIPLIWGPLWVASKMRT